MIRTTILAIIASATILHAQTGPRGFHMMEPVDVAFRYFGSPTYSSVAYPPVGHYGLCDYYVWNSQAQGLPFNSETQIWALRHRLVTRLGRVLEAGTIICEVQLR
jgi:hypothetical protein